MMIRHRTTPRLSTLDGLRMVTVSTILRRFSDADSVVQNSVRRMLPRVIGGRGGCFALAMRTIWKSCWPTTLYGLMRSAPVGPQVAFLGATDPSTGRQGKPSGRLHSDSAGK